MNFKEQDIQKIGMILLRTGSMLQSCGTCTARIRIILARIANTYDLTTNTFITHRALTLTLLNKKGEPVFNSVKRTAPVGVNFKVVAGISRMSMDIRKEIWSLKAIEQELCQLEKISHYPQIIILLMVSLAGASFCFLADGNILAMAVCFVATFAGLFIRQETSKIHFNPYLCVFLAALTATFVAGSFRSFFPEINLEHGFATSVLFLIPGVPLINSFVDFIDGNLLNGIIRLTNGFIFSFMIALGMICTILIFNFL